MPLKKPLLMIISVCFVLLISVTTVFGQAYEGSFDIMGSYTSGDEKYCSINLFPDNGVKLSPGQSLTGTLTADASIYMAIITSMAQTVNHKGGVGCAALLGNQFYYNSGTSIQFKWTATISATYYVALVNNGPNEITGYLIINQA